MIHRVFSSDDRFKEVTFQSGLNVLLSDVTSESTDKQTRNRAGKSSLVHIVRFLLGTTVRAPSIFLNRALANHRFGMEFDLGGQRVTVERQVSKRSRVHVKAQSFEDWPVEPSEAPKFDGLSLKVDDWKTVLLSEMFGSVVAEGTDALVTPSSSQLLSYFARTPNEGMRQAKRTHSQMGTVEYQTSTSLLLGLEWTIASRWKPIHEKEAKNKQFRKAARDGDLGAVGTSSKDLFSELVLASERGRQLQERLDNFELLPEYKLLEDEASQLGMLIGDAVDQNALDRQAISELTGMLEREVDPPVTDVQAVFSEAGVRLTDQIVRTYEDVIAFHQSVVRNRRLYLEGEIESRIQQTAERSAELERNVKRQKELLAILRPRGSDDQYDKLYKELATQDAIIAGLGERLRIAEELESSEATLTSERNELRIRLAQELREQDAEIAHAVLVFGDYSNQLYKQSGRLTIDATPNGPEIDLAISGGTSEGINQMQIFCFDLTIMQICCERGVGPGFLIHDSHLFDGVDERQVRLALEIARDASERFGYQYITSFNSDVFPQPSTFGDGTDLGSFQLSTRLIDADDDGGLFGFRFG